MCMEKKFILIKDAAAMLGVSALTLRNWDRDGKLLAHRHPISNYRMYKIEDIENIINQIESGERPFRRNKPAARILTVRHLSEGFL